METTSGYAGKAVIRTGRESGAVICTITERQAQGGAGAQVESGVVHSLTEGDPAMRSPCYLLPRDLMTDWETSRHLGGHKASDSGQGDCLYIRALPLQGLTV